ncbi:MAG: ABC transporter ATP-binding protein [Gammaproteobacteria bacterium]|nr:ABC transporter ATP-binding protein [Gammaproteobacteria bacterium]
MEPRLDVRQLSAELRGNAIVQNATLQLSPGKIGAILGPSGCGKTTLLRSIAGFQVVSAGEIYLRGKLFSKKGFTLPPEQRHIGMLFQDLALFPHLSVEQNIRFGLRKLTEEEQRNRMYEVLELTGLASDQKKHPHQLSGGQQQRVALARALAPKPEILLLDEPFSSLDPQLREQVATDVRKILKRENVTSILVTHDQHEAFAMADEVGVMNEGHIAQWDTAYNIYHRPKTRFVADFIGLGSMIAAKVIDDTTLDTEFGIMTGKLSNSVVPGQMVDLLIRPDDIPHDDSSAITALVEEKRFRGADFLYKLRLVSGSHLLCYAPSHHNHQLGEPIGIRIDVEHLVVFPQTDQTSASRIIP